MIVSNKSSAGGEIVSMAAEMTEGCELVVAIQMAKRETFLFQTFFSYVTSIGTMKIATPVAKIEELDSILAGLESLKVNGGYTTDAKGRHWMTRVSMK